MAALTDLTILAGLCVQFCSLRAPPHHLAAGGGSAERCPLLVWFVDSIVIPMGFLFLWNASFNFVSLPVGCCLPN